jgi:hypothetical protein
VQPLIYNGTTYLPARALAESLNKDIKLNELTNTLEITTRKEETALSEDLPITPTETTEVQTTTTENSDLVTYEEDGLTVVELENGDKFIELLDVKESLTNTEYQLYYYGANYYILQKLNADNIYENVDTVFKSINHIFDTEYRKIFNNRTLYLKYDDYINFIKNKIGK